MASQLTQSFEFTIRIGYLKDTTYSHASPEEWIHPLESLDKTNGLSVTIAATDLDSNGIYWLKDGTAPLGFVASRIKIQKTGGPNVLNLDFIGTYYDFDTAKDGMHDNTKDDNWNTDGIIRYLIKGKTIPLPNPIIMTCPSKETAEAGRRPDCQRSRRLGPAVSNIALVQPPQKNMSTLE